MSELATAAGVSVGQIYRLFTGKAEVILAIVHDDTQERLIDLTAIHDDVRSGRSDIETGFTRLAERALSEGDEALSFEILAEAHRNPAVGNTIATMCGALRGVIRDLACAANPDLSSTALDGAEEMLLALLFGLGHRTLSRPCLPPAETARRTARMILAALRVQA